MDDRILDVSQMNDVENVEISLRSELLNNYIVQVALKDKLKGFIEAARIRGEALDHVILHVSPGLGKTTLSNIIAAELGVNIRTSSGPAIERAGDLAAILSSLDAGDVLFIDEIHRL